MKTPAGWLSYPILGVLFGITLMRSEVLSWFRIQEMFRFQSPRMYAIIASAIAVASVSLCVLRKLDVKTLTGELIAPPPPKVMGSGVRYAVGGAIFGVGWAFTGACPGPMFALAGAGVSVMSAAILGALLGTWLYGFLRPRLPH
jgi:uncharacterized membrane protein YedE/YeeE